MAGDYNLVVLVGRLGRDPELRILQNGTPVATFPLAVDRVWPDGNGGWNRQTHWFNVVCWSKLAERVSDQFGKGSLVLVQGELQQRSWQTDKGEKRSVVEIRATLVRRMEFQKNGSEGAPVSGAVGNDYFGDEDPGSPPDL
ncbi:MAG: single-stranded DNA-binding protein [Bacillota bacterium]|nr:single-stranded DNA-binding protein [Bacillota bacterium]